MASHPIYQFYAELDDFKPSIWRRFQVQNDMTLAKLGYIVQTLFEMKANHLMAVEIPFGENKERQIRNDDTFQLSRESFIGDYCKRDGEYIVDRYEFMDEDFEPYDAPHIRQQEIRDARLYRTIDAAGDTLIVNYDFGDDWNVTLRLEKIFEDKELDGKELPRVLDGVGFGIVEDCGGTGGLDGLVKAFKRKRGAEYNQLREWLGVDDFDITAFDIDDMNFRVKKIPRIYKQCYEDRLTPTQKSIDLIERKYLRKKQSSAE